MSPVSPRSHAEAATLSEKDLEEVLREYLEAVQASVKASRALLSAGPGERQRAHRAFMEATRRQTEAERAYERARQQTHGVSFVGRHRMKLY